MFYLIGGLWSASFQDCDHRPMSAEIDELAALLGTSAPVCAALTPFEVLDVDREAGFVRLEFAPQPAFGNHFGNIQGGFLVAMLDAPLTIAAFLRTGQFLPTLEIKTSFLAPAAIGPCIAEGQVLRAGRAIVFTEARLFSGGGALAAHATATAIVPER